MTISGICIRRLRYGITDVTTSNEKQSDFPQCINLHYFSSLSEERDLLDVNLFAAKFELKGFEDFPLTHNQQRYYATLYILAADET